MATNEARDKIKHNEIKEYFAEATSLEDRMARRAALPEKIRSDHRALETMRRFISNTTSVVDLDIERIFDVVLQFELESEERKRRPYWHPDQKSL